MRLGKVWAIGAAVLRSAAVRPLFVCVLMLQMVACATSVRQTPAVAPAAAPAAAAQQTVVRSDSTGSDTTFVMPDLSLFTRMTSGLLYYDVVVGSGIVAVDQRELDVHYTGRLESGQIFDSSRLSGTPIRFVLGRGRVIPGWEQGIRGMRMGGRRILIIPPALAYGPTGSRDVIPPNATLTFDVELVSVR